MASAWVFILIALAYALLKIYLEKRWAGLDAAGEEPELSSLAFSSGQSVYELFRAAGTKWNVTATQLEDDFRRYLKGGPLPHYMRDFLRGHLQRGDRTYQQLIFSGGRPPYL